MSDTQRVLVVTDGDPPDGVVEALASEWTVSVRRPADVAETPEADCLVCCDTLSRAWAMESAPAVPTVACGDAPITRGGTATAVGGDPSIGTDPTVGGDSIVETDPTVGPDAIPVTDGDGLDCPPEPVVDSVRRALADSDLTPARNDRRVTDLHEGVTAFAAIREPETVFERTVEIAERVLAFDRCAAMRHHDGALVPIAQSGDTEIGDARPMSVETGIAGWCFRNGQSRLIDRVDADPDARPSKAEFVSGLSVPIGDHGVFQAVSTEPAAFDERDLELAELLATHAGETLSRIETTSELRRERDRLQSLFENVPDPAIDFELIDGNPVVRQINAAFEDVFGYESETVVGRNVDEFVLPEDGEERQRGDRFNRQLREGKNVSSEVIRLTDDGPRHFILQVIPLELDSHNVSGFAIYTDITEQQQREEKLRRQNERLDEFASIISHDLRNPLSVATGFLELARETGEEEHFDRADRALDDMQEFLDDLLQLAREGRLVGDLEDTGLEDVTRRAWANVATADAILEFEEGCSLSVDQGRVTELLENLFVNAIEHASPAPTVRVGTLPCDSGDPPGFYVADDGPGIPADDRDRVFESGYTTDESGTGLGLAIVDRIADAHGWDVDVIESESGGARFEFRFGE